MIPEGVGPYTTDIPPHWKGNLLPGAQALFGSGKDIHHLSQKIEVCAQSEICIWINEFRNKGPVMAHYLASKDYLGLHYLVQGKVSGELPPFKNIDLDDTHYSIYGLVPDEPHAFTLYSIYTLSIFISFKRSVLEELIAKHPSLRHLLPLLDKEEGSVHLDMAWFSEATRQMLMQQIVRARHQRILDHNSYYKSIFFELLNRYPEDTREAKRSKARELDQKRAFAALYEDIKLNYKNDLRIATLAARYFNCESTMEVVCKAETGMTVGELITTVRLDNVKKDLLEGGPIIVAQLAGNNGFGTRDKLLYAWKSKTTQTYLEFQTEGLLAKEEAGEQKKEPDSDEPPLNPDSDTLTSSPDQK